MPDADPVAYAAALARECLAHLEAGDAERFIEAEPAYADACGCALACAEETDAGQWCVLAELHAAIIVCLEQHMDDVKARIVRISRGRHVAGAYLSAPPVPADVQLAG